MRHLGIVASSAPQAFAPTITIATTTNFNQNRATFNATVNPNGATASVKFQFKKSVDSLWTDGATITGITGGSQSVFSNQTGLEVGNSAGTIYNVRAIATNSSGESTSSSTTFTTWRLIPYANDVAGSYTLGIPTITPTGGTAVIPSLLNILVVGGGGASDGVAGGGGGGYNSESSASFSSTANATISFTVGGPGGSSSISASNFTTISAGAGTNAVDFNGGNVGSGDNPAYTGGAGSLYGDPKSGYYVNGGGGAGAAGNGGAASQFAGGAGGAGVLVSGYGVSAGAGGVAQNGTNGGNGAYWGGYGSGATAATGAVRGLVVFAYYGV